MPGQAYQVRHDIWYPPTLRRGSSFTRISAHRLCGGHDSL